MNKKIMATLLLSSLILTGCSNDKKYEDLERRVSTLEKRVGIVETSNNTQATQNNQTSNIEETTSSQYQGIYTYSLEGMSNDEIIAECTKYFNMIPQMEGKTIEDYYNFFEHDKCFGEDYFPSRTFAGNYANSPEIDCVISINGSGLYEQMDGTFGLYDTYNISICLFIKDFNKAQDLYDKGFNYLKSNCQVHDINDDRDGVDWEAQAWFDTSSNSSSGIDLCSMQKGNEGYFITFNYYAKK